MEDRGWTGHSQVGNDDAGNHTTERVSPNPDPAAFERSLADETPVKMTYHSGPLCDFDQGDERRRPTKSKQVW